MSLKQNILSNQLTTLATAPQLIVSGLGLCQMMHANSPGEGFALILMLSSFFYGAFATLNYIKPTSFFHFMSQDFLSSAVMSVVPAATPLAIRLVANELGWGTEIQVFADYYINGLYLTTTAHRTLPLLFERLQKNITRWNAFGQATGVLMTMGACWCYHDSDPASIATTAAITLATSSALGVSLFRNAA